MELWTKLSFTKASFLGKRAKEKGKGKRENGKKKSDSNSLAHFPKTNQPSENIYIYFVFLGLSLWSRSEGTSVPVAVRVLSFECCSLVASCQRLTRSFKSLKWTAFNCASVFCRCSGPAAMSVSFWRRQARVGHPQVRWAGCSAVQSVRQLTELRHCSALLQRPTAALRKSDPATFQSALLKVLCSLFPYRHNLFLNHVPPVCFKRKFTTFFILKIFY